MPPIVEPFKKSKSKTLNSKYLRLIKDFNFYYMPSMFSITSDITRNYREVKSKNLDNPNLLIEPTYDKDFMWTRDYAFKFNLTRNLVVDFMRRRRHVSMSRRGSSTGRGTPNVISNGKIPYGTISSTVGVR